MSSSIQIPGSSPIHGADSIVSQNPVEAFLLPQSHIESNPLLSIEDVRPSLNKVSDEIALQIFSYVLLDLGPNKILNVAEYKKGVLIPEAWPAIYKAFSFLFQSQRKEISWTSQLNQLQSIVNDARTYGNKTLRQIFYGLNLIKSAADSLTVEDFMRAGIISRHFLHIEHPTLSASCQQHFLTWLCEKRARVLVCLCWAPAQVHIPILLEEAAKHNDFRVFRSAFDYTTKYKLQGITPTYGCALLELAKNNNVQSVQYIFHKHPQVALPSGMLHSAAGNGSLEMVKLLVDKGVDIDALDMFKRTVLQTSIITLYSHHFSSSSRTYQKARYKKAIDQIYIMIFLMQKASKFEKEWKPFGSTLLHMACYISFSDDSEWLAQYMIKKDKNFIHGQDENGNTPLQCAGKEKNKKMAELLIKNGAITSKLDWVYALINFSLYGSGMWKVVWQNRGNKVNSTEPASAVSSAPPAPLQPRNDKSRDVIQDRVVQGKSDSSLSWGRSIYRVYARVLSAITFIPRNLYEMCRDAMHVLYQK